MLKKIFGVLEPHVSVSRWVPRSPAANETVAFDPRLSANSVSQAGARCSHSARPARTPQHWPGLDLAWLAPDPGPPALLMSLKLAETAPGLQCAMPREARLHCGNRGTLHFSVPNT